MGLLPGSALGEKILMGFGSSISRWLADSEDHIGDSMEEMCSIYSLYAIVSDAKTFPGVNCPRQG